MTGPEMTAARKRMGMTQDTLAQRLGVHVDTVSRWERGTREISNVVATAMQMIEQLGLKNRPNAGGDL